MDERRLKRRLAKEVDDLTCRLGDLVDAARKVVAADEALQQTASKLTDGKDTNDTGTETQEA